MKFRFLVSKTILGSVILILSVFSIPEISKAVYSPTQSEINLLRERITENDKTIRIGNDYLNRNPNASNLEYWQNRIRNAQTQNIKDIARLKELLPRAAKEANPKEDTEGECSLFSREDWLNCLTLTVAWIGSFILWLVSWILYVANEFFNKAIYESVQNFSSYADLSSIKGAWSTIRNLTNIGFIFVLLYAAVGMTLRLSSFDSKKVVVRVIIVALLINFSAFFTRALIDASNLLANQFYQQVGNGERTVFDSPDISAAIVANIPIYKRTVGTWINNSASTPETPKSIGLWQTFVETAGGSILLIITAFILFAGGFLFALRLVRLLFLLILSPLAYFFSVLPKTSEYSKKWWGIFWKDIIFAPVYIIMIFLVVKIITDNLTVKDQSTGSLIYFFIIITFMALTLVVANSLGAQGAGAMMKLGKKLKGGTTGFLGRHTLGRIAHKMAKSERVEKWMAKSPRLGGALKDFAEYGAKQGFGSKTSFDKSIEEKKKRAEKIQDPARRAQYLQSLGEPVKIPIPFTGKNISLKKLPLLGGDAYTQQAVYKQMKPEDRLKMEEALERKGTEARDKVKTTSDWYIERQGFVDKKENREIAEWYKNVGPRLANLPENIEKNLTYGKYKKQLDYYDKQIREAPDTAQQIQAAQAKAGQPHEQTLALLKAQREQLSEAEKGKMAKLEGQRASRKAMEAKKRELEAIPAADRTERQQKELERTIEIIDRMDQRDKLGELDEKIKERGEGEGEEKRGTPKPEPNEGTKP